MFDVIQTKLDNRVASHGHSSHGLSGWGGLNIDHGYHERRYLLEDRIDQNGGKLGPIYCLSTLSETVSKGRDLIRPIDRAKLAVVSTEQQRPATSRPLGLDQ